MPNSNLMLYSVIGNIAVLYYCNKPYNHISVLLTSNNECSIKLLQQPLFDPTQPAQQRRPTTSVARPNKKCWTAHNCAEAHHWAQYYSLNNWISLCCNVSSFHWTTLMQAAPSPRVVGGLAPQKISKPPQIETQNTINQLSFCQLLECQAPPYKRKAPLLKTFWRRFWMQDTLLDITGAGYEYDFVWLHTGYSILVQWKDTTQVYYNGVTDVETRVRTSRWQAKCINWAPFCLYFGIQYSFGFQ